MASTATARLPMLAERTAQHDSAFRDGVEYLGFSSFDELISIVRRVVSDEPLRRAIGRAARERCLTSGYSTTDRAREMVSLISAQIEIAFV